MISNPTNWRVRRRGIRPSPSNTFRQRAFTIIELVIVVLIVSIFAAVTAPAFLDSLVFHRIETAARRVKADIDQARSRARLTSAFQSVSFTGAAYTLSSAKGLDNPNSVYAVDLRKPPYSVESAAADFNGSQVLAFDGYGNPSSGGTVVLSAKTYQCTITVNNVTGTTMITSNHAAGGTTQVLGAGL